MHSKKTSLPTIKLPPLMSPRNAALNSTLLTPRKTTVTPRHTTNSIDLCFMLDCTASMQDFIDIARKKVKDVVADVHRQYPDHEIRIGVVAYRDVSDLKRFRIFPFDTSVDEVIQFLEGLIAKGGGDVPEDVNGAFQRVLSRMQWKSSARILVHIADAPCHGREFHIVDLNDKYPKGHFEDIPWNKIFKELVEMRINYLFIEILPYTYVMFEKFEALADKYGYKKLGLKFQKEEILRMSISEASEMDFQELSRSTASKDTADTSRNISRITLIDRVTAMSRSIASDRSHYLSSDSSSVASKGKSDKSTISGISKISSVSKETVDRYNQEREQRFVDCVSDMVSDSVSCSGRSIHNC